MLKRRTVGLFIGFCCLALMVMIGSTASAEVISRQEAVDILIREVILPSPTRGAMMAFGPQKPLAPGDKIEPPDRGFDPSQGTVRAIEKPTWFFWIDDEPDAKFAHPTRYVYIDANQPDPKVNHGIIVDFQAWWPMINGKHYLSRDADRFFDCPDKVYGQAPPLDYKPPKK